MVKIEFSQDYCLVLTVDIVCIELVPDIAVDIVVRVVDIVKKVQQWNQVLLLLLVVYMNMVAELMLRIAVVFDIVPVIIQNIRN